MVTGSLYWTTVLYNDCFILTCGHISFLSWLPASLCRPNHCLDLFVTRESVKPDLLHIGGCSFIDVEGYGFYTCAVTLHILQHLVLFQFMHRTYIPIHLTHVRFTWTIVLHSKPTHSYVPVRQWGILASPSRSQRRAVSFRCCRLPFTSHLAYSSVGTIFSISVQ